MVTRKKDGREGRIRLIKAGAEEERSSLSNEAFQRDRESCKSRREDER